MSRVPPPEFMNAATVFAMTVSMASSRLPARMFQRALDLNSRESDSPRVATSAMGSRPGRGCRYATIRETTMTTMRATRAATPIMAGRHMSEEEKIQPATRRPPHRPPRPVRVAEAVDIVMREARRRRTTMPITQAMTRRRT